MLSIEGNPGAFVRLSAVPARPLPPHINVHAATTTKADSEGNRDVMVASILLCPFHALHNTKPVFSRVWAFCQSLLPAAALSHNQAVSEPSAENLTARTEKSVIQGLNCISERLRPWK